ncbi:MAG TPA: hypothetical protein VJN02_07425 [Gammaproteobacteria bacterium]|nr:hypothetical protein [Gammaproteobacteria bacterium]
MTELPLKSTAVALLFSVILGPIGLLYASLWGGILMISLGMIIVSSKLFLPIAIFWAVCSIWAVGSVEAYNKKILYDKKNN